MQLVVLSVLDFDFAIAVRPLRGASNRNTSGSAGGYLLVELLTQRAGDMQRKPHILGGFLLGRRRTPTLAQVLLKCWVILQWTFGSWPVYRFASDCHTYPHLYTIVVFL